MNCAAYDIFQNGIDLSRLFIVKDIELREAFFQNDFELSSLSMVNDIELRMAFF